MRYIGIITLLVLCLTLLLLTGCMTNTVTPEIDMGNSNNPSSNNPNSNNYQNPSTDPVEEQATEEPATVEVDTTKPVITGSRDPLPNSFGWNNTDVTVSFSCADTGAVQSGIDINTVAGKTLTTEGKNQSVTNTGVCIDVAGNVADPVTVSNINIDKTPPVVTITLPGTGEYVLNQSITATWSATDALSGVVSPVSGTVSIDTSSVGTKTFTLPAGTAKDKAGKSSLKVTKSYSVIADTEDPGTVYPQKWATGTGTVGDPWANDCIQKAYDAVPVGGTIYFRAGYYALSAQWNMTKAINIIGEGINRTFIVTVDAAGIVINATDYCTLKGFTIDGAAQGDDENKPNIYIYNCNYTIVEDVETKNSGQLGIDCAESSHSYFHNVYAHDNYEHGIHGGANIQGRNTNNTYRDIYCYNNGVNGFDDFDYTGGTNNNVYDNINAWDNEHGGIAVEYLKGCVLSNLFASGNGTHGIYIGHCEDINVHDCFVTLSREDGIAIDFSDNISLVNVISKNNNGESGISIYDGSAIILTNCQLYDDRGTKLQDYGIVLGDESTTDYVELTNCTLMPNKIAAMYNGSGAIITVARLVRFYQL